MSLRLLFMNRKYDQTVGGVERMSVAIANEMAQRGHECHIVSLDLPDAQMYFDLSPAIAWHRISEVSAAQKAGWGERFRRFFKLRRIIRDNKIDVAIGFQDGAYLSVVTSAIGTGVPVIAAERNAPSRFDHLKNKNLKAIAFNSFRFADRVTVQCPSYKKEYPSYLARKIDVIANPVQPATSYADPASVVDKNILFVGRLDYQKNAGALVQAFSLLSSYYPDWKLILVGDGDRRGQIEAQVKALGLEGRVVVAGATKDVERFYKSAHLFCLPSLWEGFPNALAEAMAHGLPCVGFAGCSGVNDLIVDGQTGFLAKGGFDDAQALAGALEKLMSDPALRGEMGRISAESMKAFTPKVVFDQWEDLFKSLAASA